jgi:hypothetical protein
MDPRIKTMLFWLFVFACLVLLFGIVQHAHR